MAIARRRGRPTLPPADRKVPLRGSLSPAAARHLLVAWSACTLGTVEEREEIDRLLAPVIGAARRIRGR